MRKNYLRRSIPLLLALGLLAGCQQATDTSEEQLILDDSAYVETDPVYDESVYVDITEMEEIDLEDEAVALASSPAAVGSATTPVASGTAVEKNDKAVVDYSNTKDGYVMVNFTASTSKRLKVQVSGPSTKYTYDLSAGAWTTFPLSDGNGNYTVTVFENTSGSKYAKVLNASFKVALSDEFAPFIRPNQYVDYSNAPNTVKQAQSLAGGVSDPLQKVEKIYDFVGKNLTYDQQKAETVKSGYLPVLDTVLSSKKGICFDYAALMTGMLRSQGVPCKLVVGYAGQAYHAWISVWTAETGWVDGAIYFNGSTWQRMDPTFASSSNSSESVMKYIGDGSNYTTKYVY